MNLIQMMQMAAALAPIFSKPKSRDSSIEVDKSYLEGLVRELSFERVYGSKENDLARDIVIREFSKIFGDGFVDAPFQNVFVGNPKTARILIGAHYDSVPGSPGADDNASAVAVMLAVARTIGVSEGFCFVAFNSEENNLDGSEAFVNALGENKLEQVHVLEMVGYRDRTPGSQKNPLSFIPGITDVGDFLGVVGNDRGLVQGIIDCGGISDVPVIGIAIPKGIDLDTIAAISGDFLRSDHAHFWRKGIPAVMWTDTSNFRNPNYHKSTDTPDTLDYDYMAEVARILIKTVTHD